LAGSSRLEKSDTPGLDRLAEPGVGDRFFDDEIDGAAERISQHVQQAVSRPK